MLAYAPRSTARLGSPRTLTLVAAGHVVAIGLALTIRSEITPKVPGENPEITFVDPIKPPPPIPPADPAAPPRPSESVIDTPPRIIPTPMRPAPPIVDGPSIVTIDPTPGPAVVPQPRLLPEPAEPAIVRTAPRFITPAGMVRPPYPTSKQRLGEEASLRLSLSIDARGRVTAVSPVGAADPAFLEAARRHIVRHWRYQPANEGGTAIASTIVVTLTFKLEE